MSVVKLITDEGMDDTAELWLFLMSVFKKSPLSQAEKIGVIEFVKHEILADMLVSFQEEK